MTDYRDGVEALARDLLGILQQWRGRGTALSRPALCRRLSCGDRELRLAVRELRLQGHPIIAESAGGYRFAESADEVDEFVDTLSSRIKKLSRLKKSLQTASAREFGPRQESLL